MCAEQHHSIKKYRIELKLGNEKNALKTQQRFLSAAKKVMTGELEDIFDEVAGDKKYLRIKKLEIDIGTVYEKVLEKTIFDRVPALIEEELKKSLSGCSHKRMPGLIHQESEQDQSSHTEVLEHDQYLLSLFVHFLKQGSLPWWAPKMDFHSFEKEIIQVFHSRQDNHSYGLTDVLKRHKNAVERLILQFSEGFLVELISFVVPGKEELVLETVNAFKTIPLKNQVNTVPERLKKGIYLPIFKALSSFRYVVDSPREWLKVAIDHFQRIHNTIDSVDVLNKLSTQYQNIKDLETRNELIQAIHLILREEHKKEAAHSKYPINDDGELRFTEDRKTQKKEHQKDTDNGGIRLETGTPVSLSHPHSASPKEAVNKEQNDLEFKDNHLFKTQVREISPSETPHIKKQELKLWKVLIPEEKKKEDNAQNRGKYDRADGMKTHAMNVEPERPIPSRQAEIGPMKDRVVRGQQEEGTLRLKENTIPGESRTTDSHAGMHSQEPAIFAKTKEDADYYIRNAGLVILAPFFPMFFQELRLLKENEFRDKEAGCRAVHILQHVVDKSESPPENELVFNKILCGIPVEEPIERDIRLTDHEKTCVRDLLDSVIKHWTALKGSSADGLREGFLKREGRLNTVEDGWKLIVERKTLDILLSKIPWGFSVIRLPWMHSLMYVEW